MFDLDFRRIHRYMFPTNVDETSGLPFTGKLPVPLLKPSQPRSGWHICRSTIFTSGSLAFICYARNQFDPGSDEPTSVKLCLKVTGCIRKRPGKYGSPLEPTESVSLECSQTQMVGIWNVLRQRRKSYSIRLTLPGMDVKEVQIKHQAEGGAAFFLSMHEGPVSVNVSFDEGEALQFQAVILAVGRILYPHLSGDLLARLLDEPVAPVSVAPSYAGGDSQSSSQAPAKPELCLRKEGEPEISPGVRKAIYAICMQKWPEKRQDVAQFIQQQAGGDTAQQIVDAANKGDFKWFDDVKEMLDGNSHDAKRY